MRIIKAALINNLHYCKFPENVHDIKAFIAYLNHNYHSFVELEFFVEEGCVAPFFIEEDLKTEVQYWNPSAMRLIKECELSILSRSEYESQLRRVIQEKCTQCTYYSEDLCEEDFKSHIEHISLNGECFGFEKKTGEN